MRGEGPVAWARRRWRERWERWLDHRLPATDEMYLDHRNVFVFPTDVGFAYGVVSVLVFLCGVNYSNSLILGLSFLMLSVGVVSIHLTFFALSGARLTARATSNAFVGEQGNITVRISAGRRGLPSVRLILQDVHVLHVEKGQSADVTCRVPVRRRGRQSAGRVLIETTWPFSLVRCWTWWQPSLTVLGYPLPESHDSVMERQPDFGDGSTVAVAADPSPDDLRLWRDGDPLSRIAWRVSLRSGELHVRDGVASSGVPASIDVETMPGPGLERRYAQAAYSVIARLSSGAPTGLRTPCGVIVPDAGPDHLEQCLVLLAESEST